jgi:hypothetical protein
MRGAFLSVILMIIAAVMMGCTDSFIPCTEDADCVIDMPGDGRGHGPPIDMVCNLEVSPLERCEEIVAYLDWLPEWIPIPLPDCTSLPAEPGVCESSWGWF